MTPLLLLPWLAAAPLSLDEALRRSEQGWAVRGATEAVQRRASLQAQVSGLTFNPVVSVQPGARLVRSPGPEVAVAIEQSFNLAGHGQARRASLDAELDEATAAAGAERVAARWRAAQAWVSLWLATSLEHQARQEAQSAQSLVEKVQRAARAEALTRIEVAAARAWKAEADLAVLSAEGEVFEASVQLAMAIGAPPETGLTVNAELPELEVPAAPDALALPEVLRLRAAATAERRRADELRTSRGVALVVGAQGGRESDGALLGQLTLGVHLPLFDRAERERATLESAAVRLQAQAEGATLEARGLVVLASHELEHTREALTAVQTALLPSAVDSAAGTQALFERGEATVHDVFFTRRALVAAQARLRRAEAMHLLARLKLSELSNLMGAPR